VRDTPDIWRDPTPIVKAWLRLGDEERALELINECGTRLDADLVTRGGSRIAAWVIERVEAVKPSSLYGSIQWDFPRIADALAQHGFGARAAAIMKELAKDDFGGAPARSWLAVAAARRNDLTEVTTIVRRERDPWDRSSRYVDVAAALDGNLSLRFLAAAIAENLWPALPALAERDPNAYTWAADDYLALWA
jgi:hypothetical protein